MTNSKLTDFTPESRIFDKIGDLVREEIENIIERDLGIEYDDSDDVDDDSPYEVAYAHLIDCFRKSIAPPK